MKQSACSRSSTAFRAAATVALLLLLCAAVSFLVPFFAAVAPAFSGTGGTGSYGARALLRIAAYTLAQSLCSTLTAAAVGIPAAFFVAERRFPGRRLLMSFSAVPLCMPALVTALGYITMFGMSGHVNRILCALFPGRFGGNPPVTFLYSFAGIVVTQGFYNFPLVMATVASAWEKTDRTEEQAARILGASKAKVFRDITVVQLAPAVFSACIPVFLFCFFSFMIVLLFGATGGTTFEVAIYYAGRTGLDFTAAARLSLMETATALCILTAWTAAEKRTLRSRGLSLEHPAEERHGMTRGERPFFLGLMLVITVFFVLPFISIALSSAHSWKKLLASRSFPRAVLSTLLVGTATAAFSTAAAAAYTVLTMRHPKIRESGAAAVIPLLPMAVSSVALGTGMIRTVRASSPLVLVMAQTALMWPFAYRQIRSHAARIPQGTLDSATILSPSRLDAAFRVQLPLMRGGIAGAFTLTLALSAGDATLPLVLAIPGFETLPLLTYRLAGSYRLDEASAAGLFLGILCMALYSVPEAVRALRRRHHVL